MTIGLTNWDDFQSRFDGAQAFLRVDARGNESASDRYRILTNAKAFSKMYANAKATGMGDSRLDAMGDGAGLHLARQLEHIYAEVLKDKYSSNDGLDLFVTDRSVPPGARNHTQRRIKHNGEARFYEGNASRAPTVSVEQREETFNVAPVVTSIRINFFDQLAADFSGFALRSELEDAARDVMDRFIDDKIWNGAPSRNLPGVLNYPWVAKATSPVTIGTSTPEAILADLHAKANRAATKSKGVFSPNRMLASIRVQNYLATTKRSATTEDTILSAFLRDNPYIDEVIPVHALREAGPNGTDVMIFDRKVKDAFARVMPRDFTMLPAIDHGFDLEIPCYAIYGGMISREPMHNLITYVATSGLG